MVDYCGLFVSKAGASGLLVVFSKRWLVAYWSLLVAYWSLMRRALGLPPGCG
jgi:hypothetical protein